MEFFTHALASYAMAKAFFPRVSHIAVAGIVFAGTAADLDMLSEHFSPAAFLQINRVWGHSLLAACGITFIAWSCCILTERRRGADARSGGAVFAAIGCAAALHLLLDVCQSAGAALFWPFNARRFSSDWLPPLDIWIIFILLAGLILPLLFGLIADEIGSKSKAIRGQREAAVSLMVVAVYICFRIFTHEAAVSALASRSYSGNSARAAAALPASQSPFRWVGVVETESAWHILDVAIAPGGPAKIAADRAVYKPEDSAELTTARNTPPAKQFLQRARFPKVTVEKSPSGGTLITLREVVTDRYSSPALVMAVVELDPAGKVREEGLAWDSSAK